MSTKAIHIENLTFGYNSSELVINNLDLSVGEGNVYGFLGANGAGKTTTLKMILQLIKSYEGTISVFGENSKKAYPYYLKQIGSLIESPSFYSHLSAIDNLKIWSKYYQADQKRIPEVLEMVDLSEAKTKKTGKYSTGMKQRLGLATALLHDPKLLILDEPTNGLDPMGIADFRKVMSRLNSEGKTIILSSHILSEVEKMVTHLGILKDGALIFEGTPTELHSQKEQNIEVTFHVDYPSSALQFISHKTKSINEEGLIHLTLNNREEIPELVHLLTQNGIKIYEVRKTSKNLEDMFLSISEKEKL